MGSNPTGDVFLLHVSSGQTTLAGNHIREGVVVKLAHERYDARVGRVVLKYLNDDYLLNAKLADADTTDV